MSVSVTLYLKFALLTMKECVPRSWSESASLVCNKDAYGEQKCTDIPAMDCKDVDKEKCWDEPREKCHDVPNMVCQDVPKEKCWDEPRKSCHNVPKMVCNDVPKEKCWDEPRQECHDVPRQVCENVTKEYTDYEDVEE